MCATCRHLVRVNPSRRLINPIHELHTRATSVHAPRCLLLHNEEYHAVTHDNWRQLVNLQYHENALQIRQNLAACALTIPLSLCPAPRPLAFARSPTRSVLLLLPCLRLLQLLKTPEILVWHPDCCYLRYCYLCSNCIGSYIHHDLHHRCSITNLSNAGQHTLTTRESCDLPMVSWVCPLGSALLQQHPNSSVQELFGSATISGVFAKVLVVQYSLPLNCRCGSVSEFRSSSLGSAIEFPSLCTLLESKRSTQLLRLMMRQASANMTCCQHVFTSPDNHSCYALSSEQLSSPIRVRMRSSTHISCLSPCIDPTSWVLACVHSVALSCVLWDTSPLQRCQSYLERHTPTSITKLRYKVDSADVSF